MSRFAHVLRDAVETAPVFFQNGGIVPPKGVIEILSSTFELGG